jgi:hypothetical protein
MWSDTLMESLAECAYQTCVLYWMRVNRDHKGSVVFTMYRSVIIEIFVCMYWETAELTVLHLSSYTVGS